MSQEAAGASAGLVIEDWLDQSRAFAERELMRLVPPDARVPQRLGEAMRYALFGGGKRLRPALVRLAALAFGAGEDAAAVPAVAVELVHTYSLVHDDLPCMDDDELRRGRPTCHVVYGEALAVLVGDALLTQAFELLATRGGPSAAEMCAVLARAAGPTGMVGGQVLDLFPLEGPPGIEGVRSTHALKTAALFSAALELGALAARATREQRTAAAHYGRALGLCFQAVDDVLDVVGDASTLGKTPGKDQRLERDTLVRALGLAGAQAEARRCADEALEAARALGWGPQSPAQGLVRALLARRA